MVVGLSRREDYVQRANAALGGTLGALWIPEEINTVIERGEGPYLYDVDGRRYLDYLLGSGPVLLGHARPEITQAVQEQVAKGLTYFAVNEPVVRLAERMIEIIPCAERIRFTSTGTEATFFAIRIARAYSGKMKILKFEGGFHGVHDQSLMSAWSTVPTHYPNPIPDSAGIPPQAADDVLVSRWNDVEMTERLVAEHAHELACVICEPLQRALMSAPGFLKELRAITERHGVLLIFDEIVTGFRLALGGAQEKYDVTPDLATFGKALSAGYPMAAIAGKLHVMEAADLARRDRGEPLAVVAGTMSGNPVGAAAALASLDLLSQPGVYERLYYGAERIKDGIRELASERGVDVQVIGEGPLFQVLFSSEPVTDHPSYLRSDRVKARKLGLECIRRGLLTTPGEKFYMSLMHDDQVIEDSIEIIADAFDAVLNDA
ncbi:MAG: aspartate aminotransferase family protein [Chloroflexi bacterium]|nr:MAG: aspartate aminotransferase family protein [Chloroflexota bacterium]